MSVPVDTATRFYDVAAALRDCAREALALTDAGVPADMRSCVVPGAIAWDTCQCGQLDVTATSIFLSRQFPTAANGAESNCAAPYVVASMTVSVLRCAPTVDSRGNLPTCAQLDEATTAWAADADAIREAVRCCLVNLVDTGVIAAYALGDQTPQGPEGGCVGSLQALSVGLNNACC